MTKVPSIGERVQFHAPFLRSTGQYTGPAAPTSVGPFARGVLVDLPGDWLALVRWDDGTEGRCHRGNLEACR